MEEREEGFDNLFIHFAVLFVWANCVFLYFLAGPYLL